MANYTIKKRVLMRGDKGETGRGGIDTTVPQAGIIAYKGDEIPEGYILYSEVPDGVLTHITATYTQTATITDASSLDDLRPDLVVKAFYYDDETGITTDITVTDYTLSGTLEVGTSTITASYKGFSDSFDVTVEESITYLYKWDFTQSLNDEVQGVTASLSGATFTQGVGVSFDNGGDMLTLWGSQTDGIMRKGRTYEIDFSSFSKTFSDSHGRLFMVTDSGGFIWRNQTYSQWEVYDKTARSWQSYTYTSNNANVFDGKTAKIIISNDGQTMEVYANDTLIYNGRSILHDGNGTYAFIIGSDSQTFYNMTITGVRIYANQ